LQSENVRRSRPNVQRSKDEVFNWTLNVQR
jgi:hypothetical protein